MSTIALHPGVAPRKLGVLKALYLYTILGDVGLGVWLLVAPLGFTTAFGLPESDPYLLGIVGAIYTAFAVGAAFGLFAPMRFVGLVFLQLVYKSLWLGLMFAPRALHGEAPDYAWLIAAVFASYVVLDLLALPFRRLLADD